MDSFPRTAALGSLLSIAACGVLGGGSYTGLLVTQDKVALLAKDLENTGPSFSRLLLACSGEGFGRTFG